jgi:integrase
MQQARYQQGSLKLEKRSTGPDIWVFRYYVDGTEGHPRIYRKQPIGDVQQLPKRKDAERAVISLRLNINNHANFVPRTVAELVAHYQNYEFASLAFSTADNYKTNLNRHILPKFGDRQIFTLKTVEVEAWLRGLKLVNGKPAAPGTRSKIRNVMSTLFSHAKRHEWIAVNPITEVRTSAKRQRIPDYLDMGEIGRLLAELGLCDRAAVMLVGSTGLRRSEMFARRWRDFDFARFQANVRDAIVRNHIGDCKTETSKKPVPLHPLVIAELQAWRAVSPYPGDDDFVFASVRNQGLTPLAPDMVLNKHIRPALQRAGIVGKVIGWHSFRHGLGTMLRQAGVDLKTAQEILRHANSRITQDIYQQAISLEKREAQHKVMFALGAGRKGEMPSSREP